MKITLRLLLAALLVYSAAIYISAQEKNGVSVKQNARAPEKQNTRQPEEAAKSDATKATESANATHYVYEFTQPEFYVRHILIEHDESGRGKITFARLKEEEEITDPFELSPAALVRIKSLWDALGFLNSQTDYQSAKQFPHLGTMRLGMMRGERKREATFNWTEDKSVFALANEYRRAAEQAIFVFDINVARQNQPLEAPKILDRLDSLMARSGISDPQQLAPLLRDLSTDERIPLIARNHAARLLNRIKK